MIVRKLQPGEMYKVNIIITSEDWSDSEGCVGKHETLRSDTQYTTDLDSVLDINVDIRDFETYEAHSMEKNRFEYSKVKSDKLYNYTIFIWIMQESDDIFL